MSFSIVVLAAGQGTRMRSDLPKVLQPLAGRPLLAHVLDAAEAAGAAARHVVYGFGGDEVRARLSDRDVTWVLQAEQLGTGHALAQALPGIPDDHIVVVLYGDVPLIRPETIHRLVASAEPDRLALLTARLVDPTGYGRVVRDDAGAVCRIVEEKDASSAERSIGEINTGLLAARASRLDGWLERVGSDNAQGEFYLTDVAELAVHDGVDVIGEPALDIDEVSGINDRSQLAAAEAAYRARRAAALMRDGAILADPARIDIRGEVACGRDVFIDVGVVFEGAVTIGDGVRIGPYCVICDSRIEQGAQLHPYSHLESAVVGPGCSVGPYGRLRPGAVLAAGARVGNFVEIKKSEIGPGSKVNHLTYIGDATIGADVNVGAGTITCNYDGANKWPTRIGDRAFIGSGVELVAPVDIGADATIGAGSTITKRAPDGQLTVARSRHQATVPGWRRPVKKKT
jgi:bifunctional UDP-N-acetylglucosamine pyrophosphorylase/glucosamine-1-phosphate N-acetyltransferase